METSQGTRLANVCIEQQRAVQRALSCHEFHLLWKQYIMVWCCWAVFIILNCIQVDELLLALSWYCWSTTGRHIS